VEVGTVRARAAPAPAVGPPAVGDPKGWARHDADLSHACEHWCVFRRRRHYATQAPVEGRRRSRVRWKRTIGHTDLIFPKAARARIGHKVN